MNERQRHRALEGREPDRFERPAVADDRGVNRADYRGDFGPEGDDRFGPPRSRDEERHWWCARHDERRRRRDGERHEAVAGEWRWDRVGREGWRRSRVSGGYGSVYDAWRSGIGAPASFGFGPAEDPGPGGFVDADWQVNRPARGRGIFAGDWGQSPDQGRPLMDYFRGRGPKNYQRSDERILEDVCERLTDAPEVDASEITVEAKDGEVTLSGTINSREEKRLAERIAASVRGVRDVINRLRVRRPERESTPSAEMPAGEETRTRRSA